MNSITNWADFSPKVAVTPAPKKSEINMGRKCCGGSCIGGNCKATPSPTATKTLFHE